MHRSRSLLLAGFACVVALVMALPAQAAPTAKPGPPIPGRAAIARRAAAAEEVQPGGILESVDTDGDLRCYVARRDHGQEFYGPGSCGTEIAVDGTLYGHLGASFDLRSQDSTGTGTAGDPWVVRTEVALGDTGVTAVQSDRVVAGSSSFQTDVTVHDGSGSPHQVLVYRAGDCFVAGSDVGYGQLVGGGGVACLDQNRAAALTWTPVSQGSSRYEGFYGTGYAAVGTLDALPGTCDCESPTDNGMALRWARDLPAGGDVTITSQLSLSDTSIDTDGDGLPDSWELTGARDAAGDVVYDLPAMGASPGRPDVFLSVEAEKDAPLSSSARKQLVAAFAAAPGLNPDGSHGISLHIVDGDPLSYSTSDAIRTRFGDLTTEPDWNAPWLHWLDHAPAGPSVFHEVLSVAWKGGKWPGVAGIAQLPGQIVVLNNCGTRKTKRTSCEASATDQAANLMHELGHNLGLRHGGGDDVQWKPNYPSVMNYYFSHTGVPGAGLTYSRWGTETFYVLDENSLSERDGLLTKVPVPAGLQSSWWCVNRKKGDKPRKARLNVKLDWDCDGKVESGRVKTSVNHDKDRDKLEPYDDWAHIELAPSGSSLGRTSIPERAARARSMR